MSVLCKDCRLFEQTTGPNSHIWYSLHCWHPDVVTPEHKEWVFGATIPAAPGYCRDKNSGGQCDGFELRGASDE